MKILGQKSLMLDPKNVCKLAELGQIVKRGIQQKNNKNKIKIKWYGDQILDLIMYVLTKLKKLVLNQV